MALHSVYKHVHYAISAMSSTSWYPALSFLLAAQGIYQARIQNLKGEFQQN